MPNENADRFDFVTEGAPDLTFGDLTSYAIVESGFNQGEHASTSGSPGDGGRAGLPNIFEGQQGDIWATVDFLYDFDQNHPDGAGLFDGL